MRSITGSRWNVLEVLAVPLLALAAPTSAITRLYRDVAAQVLPAGGNQSTEQEALVVGVAQRSARPTRNTRRQSHEETNPRRT